jgi:hypothetical protein
VMVYFFLIVALIYISRYPYPHTSTTIGQTKKSGGYLYFNVGDLDDQDNWIQIGKYEPVYYVILQWKGEEQVFFKIADHPEEGCDSDVSEKCEGEEDVIFNVDYLSKSYAIEFPNVKIVIDPRYQQIMTILKSEPYYQRRLTYS